jgi:hypothetical protein
MMKTKKYLAGLLMIFSFSVIMVSCGKEDLTGTGNVTSAGVSGGIMDLGVVEGNVRGMHVSLTNVQVSLADNSNKSALETQNGLNIFLQTESDGIIKDGVYYFSGTNNTSPFIFRRAQVSMKNQVTGNADTFDVAGGSVVVARTGTYYTINMTGTLLNGSAVRAAFGGLLSYSD